MHGYAGTFAGGEQSRDRMTFVIVPAVDLAIGTYGDAAHRVMRGRLDRYVVHGRIEVGVLLNGLDHLRQYLVHVPGFDAGHIEPYAILRAFRILRISDSSPRVDFGHDGAAYHIAGGQIGMPWRVTFHESLAIGIAQHAAFGTSRFGQQNARMCESGRMELHEFGVLKLQTGSQRQCHAIACQIPGIRGGVEQPSRTTGGDKHIACMNGMRHTLMRVERHHAFDLRTVL